MMKKVLFLMLLMMVICIGSICAQETKNPPVGFNNTRSCTVTSVNRGWGTIVTLKINMDSGWFRLSPETKLIIVDKYGVEYKYKIEYMSDNLLQKYELGVRHSMKYPKEVLLRFPLIPSGYNTINVVEPDPDVGEGWRFMGIRINNPSDVVKQHSAMTHKEVAVEFAKAFFWGDCEKMIDYMDSTRDWDDDDKEYSLEELRRAYENDGMQIYCSRVNDMLYNYKEWDVRLLSNRSDAKGIQHAQVEVLTLKKTASAYALFNAIESVMVKLVKRKGGWYVEDYSLYKVQTK